MLVGWMKPADAPRELELNRVTLKSDGSLLWNGSPVSPAELGSLSQRVATFDPRPLTALEIENGTDCDRVRDIRHFIDRQARCQEQPGRICGEGRGFLPDPLSR
jgi:hypothetical protein